MAFFPAMLRARHRASRIPVLTYHALHAQARDYGSNDHVAFEEDLALIRRLGFRVAPPLEVARLCSRAGSSMLDDGRWVALTFDDGTDYDFLDFAGDPELGRLKSFYTIMKESCAAEDAAWCAPSAVSFVIASPDARSTLDRTCIAGRGNWRDCWWAAATRTGMLHIGNHSWDHTHPTLPQVAQREQRKGTFYGVDTFSDAQMQIEQAQRYIEHRLADGASARLFAYPYGEAPDYLVEEYFPRFARRHRQLAAFGLGSDYASRDSNRWLIPRFSCQSDWSSTEELERILLGALH